MLLGNTFYAHNSSNHIFIHLFIFHIYIWDVLYRYQVNYHDYFITIACILKYHLHIHKIFSTSLNCFQRLLYLFIIHWITKGNLENTLYQYYHFFIQYCQFNDIVPELITINNESILFWISIVGVIHAFLDLGTVDDIGLFYMIFGIPLISFAYIRVIENKELILVRSNLKMLTKDTEVEMYINQMIYLIQNRKDSFNRQQSQNLLSQESNQKELQKFILNTVIILRVPAQKYRMIHYEKMNQQLKKRNGNILQEYQQRYLLIKSIISESLERFSKSCRLHLLSSYVHNQQLQNTFKAIFELIMAGENRPGLQQEFAIYRYRNILEEEMQEADLKNTELKGIDVNLIVQYQTTFAQFLKSLESAVDMHLEFWRELLEETPNIVKLQTLGSGITILVEATKTIYKKLCDINSINLRCLELHGSFLKDIVNDDVEGQRILEKADYVAKSTLSSKQFLDDKQKYGENTNICIVTISGNYNNIGIIQNANNEILRILGFSPSELIGTNISRIMSKIYSEMHDKFLSTFLDNGQQRAIPKERIVFALNKLGYLVPCKLMTKVIPNLIEGIRIVGFLKVLESDLEEKAFYMLFRNNDNEKDKSYPILGISEYCYLHFGISTQLINQSVTNSNELTMDLLCPDILKNEENLKTIGIETIIDTTSLYHNFYLQGVTVNDASFEEDHNLIQNNPNESSEPNQISTIHKQKKQSLYRKIKVRAIIIQEDVFGDVRLNLAKFIELQETDQEFSQDIQNQTADVLIVEEEVQKNSDRKSIQSNDGINNLKNFKILISEKSEAKSITLLNYIFLFLVIILIILASLILSFRLQEQLDVQEGQQSIYDSFVRHDLMADVNYNLRLLQLYATGIYWGRGDPDFESNIKKKITYLVNLLQVNQFVVIGARVKMEARMTVIAPLEKYPILFLLENYQNMTYPLIYNDAAFQFITAVSSIRNSTLESFNSTFTTDTQKDFFYTVVNGLFTLRNGSEFIAQRFCNFYHDEINKYENKFMAIMSVAISLLVVSQIILIPIIFQIHRTNARVMSLFGILPLQEIKDLVSKCENFIKTFLISEEYVELAKNTETQIKKAMPQPTIYFEVDNENVDQSQNQTKRQFKMTQQHDQQQLDQIESAKDYQEKQSQRPLALTQGAIKQVQNQVDEKKEVQTDFEFIRSHKLLNSQGNNKVLVICQFTFFASLLMAYFIADILTQIQYLKDVQQLYKVNLERLLGKRPDIIKYVVYYSFEEMITKKIQMERGTDLRKNFSDQLYKNERDIVTNQKLDYPSQITPYLDDFENFNYQNLCQQNFGYLNFIMKTDECSKVDEGLLLKGLKTAIVSIVLKSNDLIYQWNQTNKTTKGKGLILISLDLQRFLNSKTFYVFEDLLDQIIPGIEYLNLAFNQNFQDFLQFQSEIEKIKFSIFVISIFLIFYFFWRPYLKNLSKQIWRTKVLNKLQKYQGSLNMIPLEIIEKYDNLKKAFSGDILKAVK